MKSKSFILYPRTEIDIDNPSIEIVDAPIKDKLKAFISGYIEDYNEEPTIQYLQLIFGISELDAEMALYFYGNSTK